MNMLQFVSSQKSMQRCCPNLDECYFKFLYSKIGFNLNNRSKKNGKRKKKNKQTNRAFDIP